MSWTSFGRNRLVLMIGVILSRSMVLECVVTEFLWLIIGRDIGVSSLAPFAYV